MKVLLEVDYDEEVVSETALVQRIEELGYIREIDADPVLTFVDSPADPKVMVTVWRDRAQVAQVLASSTAFGPPTVLTREEPA